MDLEGETPHLLDKPASCVVPEVERVARGLGITCQQVFERAYMRKRHPSSFARAVFARFCAAPRNERILPDAVADYCKTKKGKVGARGGIRKGFCTGCMLNTQGCAGLKFAYSLIHPESELGDVLPVLAEQPELPMLEKLWMDFIDSGALEHSEENMDEIMRSMDIDHVPPGEDRDE